jgi:hypothetical protein
MTEKRAPATKGKGNGYAWLVAHKDYPHKEWCLVWPFYRNHHGQGMLGYNGQRYWAHRLMCTIVHGDPPEPNLLACHDCGNGHEGCVNPHHIQWKTFQDNALDRSAHRAQKQILINQPYGTARRMTPAQVRIIQEARGVRTQQELAAHFNCSLRAISSIWNDRTYQAYSKVAYWTPEQDKQLRDGIEAKLSFTAIGKIIGKSAASCGTRAYRLGLKSGYQQNRPRDPALAVFE